MITMNIAETKAEDQIIKAEIDGIFLLMADRSDIDAILQNEKVVKGSGIYILSGEKTYIGQSASDISARLYSHKHKKLWWKQGSLVVFGKSEGSLSRAQTDYIERTLIEYFDTYNSEKGDNETPGNFTYISEVDAINADNIIEKVLRYLKDVFVTRYLEFPEENKTIKSEVPLVDNSPVKSYTISVLDKSGKEIYKNSENSFRSSFDKIGRKLTEMFPEKIESITINGKPTTNQLYGTEENIANSGLLSTQIADKLYLFNKFSVIEGTKALQRLGDKLGITIIVEKNK